MSSSICDYARCLDDMKRRVDGWSAFSIIPVFQLPFLVPGFLDSRQVLLIARSRRSTPAPLQHLVYKTDGAEGTNAEGTNALVGLFLRIHVIDLRPACGRLAGFHRRIVPADVVIGVVAVLAKDMELQHAFCFVITAFLEGRFIRIHEVEELALSPVGVFLIRVNAAGAVAAFTPHIFQVGRRVWNACACLDFFHTS